MACNIHVKVLTDNQTECDRTFLPARYLDSLIFKEKNDVINNNKKITVFHLFQMNWVKSTIINPQTFNNLNILSCVLVRRRFSVRCFTSW